MSTTALLYFDGGARPTNPGHAGFASIVHLRGRAHRISRYIGVRTNNEAEYFGLIVGIKYAVFLGAKEIEIYTDSKLVANQLVGKWNVKSPVLRQLRKEALDLLRKFYTHEGELLWKITWQGRLHNKDADTLCTRAINWGRVQNPYTPVKLKAKYGDAGIEDPFASTRTVPVRVPSRVRQDGLSTILSDFD